MAWYYFTKTNKNTGFGKLGRSSTENSLLHVHLSTFDENID
jgi:hypothetical protein